MSRLPVDDVMAIDRIILESAYHKAWDEIERVRSQLRRAPVAPPSQGNERLLELMYPQQSL
jgi:hypothetical protein